MADARVLVGRYEVGDLVGRGGMAEVHAGWDTRLGREVAIKVLRSDLARDPSFLQRFRREAQSAAGLNHPGIVAVYDSGEDSATELGGASIAVPFIVMELIDGKTLREELHDRGGPLEVEEACRVMSSVLRALGYSHAHGLVHRDIKPANIMVARDRTVKLTDFGIARAIADSAATMTNTAVVVGTAQYLSPEQAQGKPIDARADVYAAGCVLFELLTGRAPFTGDSPLAIAYQQVGQRPERPSSYAEHLGPDLDGVVLHALEKDPDLRYQSAGEFAADLEAVAAGRRPSQAAVATAEALQAADGGSGGSEEGDGADPAPVAVPPPAAEDGSTSSFPPVPDGPPRLARRPMLVGAIAALSVVLLVVVGILAAQGRIGGIGGVTVPEVRQLSYAAAQERLRRAGLEAERRNVANSKPQETVVDQTPAAGEDVPAGSRVVLQVSEGPGQVELADLTGYLQEDAVAWLTSHRLVPNLVQVDSYEVGAGSVVDTDPKPKTSVKEGSTVTLKISTGKVMVPDVLGMPEADAKSLMAKMGLVVEASYVDDGGKPGTALEQEYRGVRVPVGTHVKVTFVRVTPRPIPTQTVTVTRTETVQPPSTSGSPTGSPTTP